MAFIQAIRLVALVPAVDWLAAGARPLRRQIESLARRMRLATPRTLVIPGLVSAVRLVLLRPWLFWPDTSRKQLSEDGRHTVIVHELAHLRRRDHVVGWLLMFAECIWWWNPVFWIVRRQIRLQAELACDAWVVHLFPEHRGAYAEALIEVTAWNSRPPALVPMLGISGAANQDFERRLTMIMCERTPCKMLPSRWRPSGCSPSRPCLAFRRTRSRSKGQAGEQLAKKTDAPLENAIRVVTDQQATKDFEAAEFYKRTGHLRSAYFQYETIRRRYRIRIMRGWRPSSMDELRDQVERQVKEKKDVNVSIDPAASLMFGVGVSPMRGLSAASCCGIVYYARVNDQPITDDDVRFAFIPPSCPPKTCRARTQPARNEVLSKELDHLVEREIILLALFESLKERQPILAKLKAAAAKDSEKEDARFAKAPKLGRTTISRPSCEIMKESKIEGIRNQVDRNFMAMEFMRNMLADKISQIGQKEVQDYHEKHYGDSRPLDEMLYKDIRRPANGPNVGSRIQEGRCRNAPKSKSGGLLLG